MNKRFSTLMTAGLLATSLLCGSAWAQDAITINGIAVEKATDPDGTTVKTWASGPYFVVVDADGTLGAGDILLKVTDKDGTLEYTGTVLEEGDNNISDLGEVSWYLNEAVQADPAGKKSYSYTLKNVGLETLLTFGKTGTVITDPEKSAHKTSADQYATFEAGTAEAGTYASQFSLATNNKLFLHPSNTSTTNKGLTIDATNGVSLSGNASALVLYKLKTQTLGDQEAVEAMNATMAGEGFNFDFTPAKDLDWANDNLSEVKLKAFYVTTKITLDDDKKMEIPAGVYFATEYPEELTGTGKIEDAELFNQCTFLAIDPTGNYDINATDRAKGCGYELTTVQGADMNFFHGVRTSDDYSHADEIFVGNACFAVEVPDAVTAPEKYNIKAKSIHVFVSSKDNAAKKHEAKSDLYIGCVADQNKNYLVTTEVASALAFTTTNSTLLDGDDLVAFLQEKDAPSVYTIQFVSGEKKEDKSEYEQYLTVNEQSSTFALASTVDFDEADPMYQFVVTGVDKTKKTITLTNRQTKHSFTVSLYENEDDVYTVFPSASTQLYVENVDGTPTNEEVLFEGIDLANTKIVLTAYTVEDKFATFVNRADNMGLVQFELALNSDIAPAFYVGGKKDDDGNLEEDEEVLAYAEADDMLQFELIKTKKPSSVLNNYIYLDGKRVRTSTKKDTVAYYTYEIKAFDDADNLYLSKDWKLKEVTGSSASADKFIIKQNLDGSVSLIKEGTIGNADAKYAKVKDLKKEKEAAWESGNNYELAGKINKGLRTFMVDETPAVSLEAVPQHISFGLNRGGFLTNKDNDAFQSIATEAGEDLTFWVDTVKADRNIPTFYIAKAGQFLYNATDSAKYYSARGNYRFNLENQKDGAAKLIFKAGELVSSDTLRTVVDGKSVLVAEEDNAPKKIKGGLAKFQFQIIKAEDGSDEYVIRQGLSNYVQMINSYFYLKAEKNTAARFTLESQSTPTSNEGVAVAEVTVIAGEGEVTVANAAGKRVVISNILGQVVANTVLASDNATVAAPQGVVVVAVEGEAAVKAIVK